MLVLSRKENEKLHIDGPCVITLLQVGQYGKPDCNVRIGIEAPDTTRIWRGELLDPLTGLPYPVNPVTGQTMRPKPHQELET